MLTLYTLDVQYIVYVKLDYLFCKRFAPAVTRRTCTLAPAVTRRTYTFAPAVTRRKAARSNTRMKTHDVI